jgi:hypothetical protein
MKQTKFSTKNVVDAEEDITLEILPRDIRHATIKKPSSCAAARACRRQENQTARIHITRLYMKKDNDEMWTRYITPKTLRTEIIAFDRGGEFIPGKYILRAPRNYEKLGKYHKGSSNGQSKRKRKRVVVKDIRTGPASGF